VQPRTLQEIDALLNDLVTYQHVGTFREIVPFELLSPHGSSNPSGKPMPVDSTNYSLIDSVVSLFKAHNVRLIFSVGNPLPEWAASWGHNYSCFLPPVADATSFNTLKNNISWTLGNYLKHLKANGYAEWMVGRSKIALPGGLIIEGFNEWNGNASYKNCSDFTAASPERAANLESAIGSAASFFGVRVELAAPSIVFPSQGLDKWYEAYYAAGGVGAPNVHIYGNGSTTSGDSNAAIQFAKSQLHGLIRALPGRFKTSVIWGETGFGDASPVCSGISSLPSSEWEQYDVQAAKLVTGGDSDLTQAVRIFTIWRLDQIANQLSCDGSFGVVSSDLQTYLPPAVQLFMYLGGSGVMGKRRQ
jgi:hypothetical protein